MSADRLCSLGFQSRSTFEHRLWDDLPFSLKTTFLPAHFTQDFDEAFQDSRPFPADRCLRAPAAKSIDDCAWE
eukprot:3828525-Pleurochrysis_carterae.AAC.1